MNNCELFNLYRILGQGLVININTSDISKLSEHPHHRVCI